MNVAQKWCYEITSQADKYNKATYPAVWHETTHSLHNRPFRSPNRCHCQKTHSNEYVCVWEINATHRSKELIETRWTKLSCTNFDQVLTVYAYHRSLFWPRHSLSTRRLLLFNVNSDNNNRVGGIVPFSPFFSISKSEKKKFRQNGRLTRQRSGWNLSLTLTDHMYASEAYR